MPNKALDHLRSLVLTASVTRKGGVAFDRDTITYEQFIAATLMAIAELKGQDLTQEDAERMARMTVFLPHHDDNDAATRYRSRKRKQIASALQEQWGPVPRSSSLHVDRAYTKQLIDNGMRPLKELIDG